MEQIVDLQNDVDFQALNVKLVSISFDSQAEQAQGALEYGISSSVPLLVDSQHTVSEAYDVLQWAVKTGEPGHTFILIDDSGNIAWIQDYGAPENRGVMYVAVEELILEVKDHLSE